MDSGETAPLRARRRRGTQKLSGKRDRVRTILRKGRITGHRRCNLPRMGRGISQVRIRGRKATALRPFLLPENGTNLKEELIK